MEGCPCYTAMSEDSQAIQCRHPGKPYPPGDGPFELRTMGTNIARGIRVCNKGNTIIMLLVFIKSHRKCQRKDLAKSRLAEVFNEMSKS